MNFVEEATVSFRHADDRLSTVDRTAAQPLQQPGAQYIKFIDAHGVNIQIACGWPPAAWCPLTKSCTRTGMSPLSMTPQL